MAYHHRAPFLSLFYASAALLFAPLFVAPALAQGGGCVLVPDKRHPEDQILRCGGTLTARPAAGTTYRPVDQSLPFPPPALQLDDGALLMEFHPSAGRRDFQILTPEAIASVRGTRWAVERKAGQTSVVVLRGAVAVARMGATAGTSVLLRRGDGVDVDASGGPLQAKQWRRERVKALLARFAR
jgi:FecR protein